MGGAYAQTAPSPADVGIDKQSPNVFKLLDTSKTWTPFGSVNENTTYFSPATNGPIPSGNCVKWGPGYPRCWRELRHGDGNSRL